MILCLTNKHNIQMPPRCEKGTRRNRKTGLCETKKNRSPSSSPAPPPPPKKPIRKIKRVTKPEPEPEPETKETIEDKPKHSYFTEDRLKTELTNIIKEFEEEVKEIKDTSKSDFTKEQRQESLKYKKILDTNVSTEAQKNEHTIKTFEGLHHTKPQLRMRDLDTAISVLKQQRKNKDYALTKHLAM